MKSTLPMILTMATTIQQHPHRTQMCQRTLPTDAVRFTISYLVLRNMCHNSSYLELRTHVSNYHSSYCNILLRIHGWIQNRMYNISFLFWNSSLSLKHGSGANTTRIMVFSTFYSENCWLLNLQLWKITRKLVTLGFIRGKLRIGNIFFYYLLYLYAQPSSISTYWVSQK